MKNLVFLSFLLSIQSFGMPVDHFDNRPDCAKSRYERQGELLQKISIMAQQDPITGEYSFKDPRGPMSEKAPELQIFSDDVRRAHETCGIVFCGDPKKPMVKGGSGCLISDRGLWTAKHVLDPGISGREKNCYFQNQTPPFKSVELDLSPSGYRVIGSADKAWSRNEMIIVRTKTRVTNMKPFPLSKGPVREGQTMILLSAFQERMSVSVPAGEPIVQSCHALVVEEQAVGPSIVESDCSSTKGASGSVAFIRDESGHLMLNSVLIGGGDVDHCKFNPGEQCYAYSLGVSQNAYAKISEFLGKDNPHLAKAPTHDPTLKENAEKQAPGVDI